VSFKKCDVITKGLTQRPTEVALKVIKFMNSSSKSDL